ncbi:MAG: tetratricopeptide repeat protein [Actinomycetota bacterium]
MNPVIAALTVASLSAVAVAGVAAGFRRRDPVLIEGPTDPLEDRRLTLLRSLADLEESWRSGALDETEYVRLRRETERGMARLLGAIDARSIEAQGSAITRAGRPASFRAAVGESTPSGGDVVPVPASGRVPPWVVAVLLVGTVASVVVTGLLRDAEPEVSPTAPGVAGDDPFAFFEDRVERQPNDVAARLDLAHRYLDAGRIEEALAEYAVVLERDPDDAEANAHVGMILYLSDRPESALKTVDRALETAPDYPEALFFHGVIQLCGLDRPNASIASFERYLEAAPFGAERGTVQDLIADAERAVTARCR